MNSGTVFAGTAGLTTMKSGTLITQATGAMSRKKETKVVVQRRVDRRRSVNHEERVAVWRRLHDGLGSDIGAGAGRFSTTNGWPRRSESCWPIRRATTSAVPPGG